MKILHTLPRHAKALNRLTNTCGFGELADHKYIIICVDPPESVNRAASFASDFNPDDTAKILAAAAEQIKD